MANGYRVNKAQVNLTASRIGYAKMRRVMRYVHRHAVVGATGGIYSRTGALAASIETVGPFVIGSTTAATVFSPLPYAASVERGAKIHPIFPKSLPDVYRFGSRRAPQLRFMWRGRMVYTPHVPMAIHTMGRSHPGQKGKRFLRSALIRAAAFYRMRFIPGPRSF